MAAEFLQTARARFCRLQRLSHLHSPKSRKGTVGFRSPGLEV